MQLLIDQILNNSVIADHALVRMQGLGKLGFSAIMTGNLNFQIGNSWSTIDQIVGGVSQELSAAAQLFQGDIKQMLDKVGIKTSATTFTPSFAEQFTELWMGPQKPTLVIDMVLINYKDNDIRKEVLSLYKAVLPGGVKTPGGLATNLTTPLNYNPRKKNQGTVGVTIGKWFRAHGLVVDNVTSAFSKEIVGDTTGGSTPLHANVSITLRPATVVTYDQFRNWFRQTGSTNE